MTMNLPKEKVNPNVSTCLFNIIFYVESEAAAVIFQKYLGSLKKKFPCRSILLIEEPGKSEDSISSFLNKEASDDLKPKAACDDIIIKFSGKMRERIPFLIFSYLVGDLPIYLIWEQDPSKKNPILFSLKDIATKIVFDPAMALHIKEFSRSVLTHSEKVKCGVTDFAWFSIQNWREVFKNIFNSPEKVDALFHATVIKIHYNRKERGHLRTESAALYLQAWIAAVLNWKVRDVEIIEENIRIRYERFIHDTIVWLIPEKTDQEEGLITSVEIESCHQSHFLLKKNQRENKITVWISSENSCEIPDHFSFAEPTKEQLVLNELFWRGTSVHYQDMLQVLYHTHWND